MLAFIPDLLFGSKVVSTLGAAGHQVELTADVAALDQSADLLIIDLTSESEERIERARLSSTPKLGFYSHVEPEVRVRAEQAGFDLVVPRSRMAREGATLADRLLAGV